VSAPALEVQSLRKSFRAVRAVRDVSFQVAGGEILGLLGPNGAGKTTTLRLIMGIMPPDAGAIRLFGAPASLAARRRIGYLPEERGLHRAARLLDAVAYLGELKGLSAHSARGQAEHWLRRFELGEALQRKTNELSRGMAQKAQVAAALLNDPAILMLDEPTQNLDPVNVDLLLEVIREQRRAGKAIVISTHVMSQVESLCDRLYLVAQGRGVLEGPVAEIRRRYAPNVVRFATPDPVPPVTRLSAVHGADGAYEAELLPGATPPEVLRELVNAGVRIERFEAPLAALDDVFIRVVQEARDLG